LYIKNMPGLFPSIKSKGQVRAAGTAKWQPCVRAYKKKTLPASTDGHELCFETMPGIGRCFLPITEFFSSGKKDGPSHPKQKEVGHIACCWVASSPNSVATIFAETTFWCVQQISKTLLWPRWPWQKCRLMYYTESMRACHECRITCQGADQSVKSFCFWHSYFFGRLPEFKFRWHTAPDFAEEYFWNLGLQHMRMRL